MLDTQETLITTETEINHGIEDTTVTEGKAVANDRDYDNNDHDNDNNQCQVLF